jgi:hypothetical protein
MSDPTQPRLEPSHKISTAPASTPAAAATPYSPNTGIAAREDLDHRSPQYISDAKGGISNKQIVLMANLITKRQEPRPFDNNWAIVTEFMKGWKKK